MRDVQIVASILMVRKSLSYMPGTSEVVVELRRLTRARAFHTLSPEDHVLLEAIQGAVSAESKDLHRSIGEWL